MGWITTDLKPTETRVIDRLGNQYRITNGYLGYRGTLEEFTREQKPVTTVSDLRDRYTSQGCGVINIPNGGYIQSVVNGVPLHVLSANVLAHAQALHIDDDIYYRRTVFSIGDGAMVLVSAKRFASLLYSHLLCIQYTLQPSMDCDIVIRSGIDGDVWELNGPHLGNFHTHAQDGILSLAAQTNARAVPVAVSEYSLVRDSIRIPVQEEKRILHEIRVRAGRYQPVVLSKFVAVYTGIESENPLTDAKSLCSAAARMGFDSLYKEHCALWNERRHDRSWICRGGALDRPPYDLAFSGDLR